MPWDKFVKPEFLTVWSRLPSAEKQAVTEVMEDIAYHPFDYHPAPVRLMSGDLLVAVLHYWIQYRLDETRRRILFVQLRMD